MRRLKYLICFILLFLLIGFATVSISLGINGNVNVLSDLDDFNVYFSNVLVNGEQDLLLVKNERKLEFEFDLREIGSTYTITYDVTNASSVFDASLSINCTNGDDLLSVVNVFDISTLAAKTTRTGNLTLKKLKPNLNATTTTYSVSCSIRASAISRDSNASGDVSAPLQPVVIKTGDVISIAGENFNVISQTEDTVTMLAQYGLGTNYRQNSLDYTATGSVSNVLMGTGWGKPTVATEIDLETYSPNVVLYIENYIDFLKENLDTVSISGTLITLNDLKELGCTISDDYNTDSMSCVNSDYASWLIINQYWLTRSADSRYSNEFYAITYSGSVLSSDVGGRGAVRPTITISKELAKKYLLKKYNVGDFVVLGNEKFNVIRDNGTTLTMFAQYNLGTDYKQSTISSFVDFSETRGWEYTPGPKEIDIQSYDGAAKTYVNEYFNYLKEQTGANDLNVDLITLKELKNLGCTINDDYSYHGSDENSSCQDSEYFDWLFVGQYWWTKSAVNNDNIRVWTVLVDGLLVAVYNDLGFIENVGIRPVVTISKNYINMEKVSFIIADNVYYAYKGMTIKDWINSSFNTDGYYYSSDYLYNSSGTKYVNVDSSTLITGDLNIILPQGNTGGGGGHSGGSG